MASAWKQKEARGGLRVGPLYDPLLGTNAVNGHFLQFPFTKASYVFKGEDSIFTIDGVVRQLFAQCPVKQSDSEAWERRRFWGGGDWHRRREGLEWELM